MGREGKRGGGYSSKLITFSIHDDVILEKRRGGRGEGGFTILRS